MNEHGRDGALPSKATVRRWRRRMTRLPSGVVASLRAFRWARAELAEMRARLPTEGVNARARRPVGIAPRGARGIALALRRVEPTCLERTLVLQAWAASTGDAPDVIIGVRAGQSDIEAHAWLEGDDRWNDGTFDEITRLGYRSP